MDLMDPHQANVKGLQLNARYYEDMNKEWALCKANTECLEALSISEVSLIWCMEEAFHFPKLKTLQFFIRGEVDMRYNRKPTADWRLVADSFRRIKAWMALHSFPALESLEILWATDVMIKTSGVEEISTEKGPETIRVDEYDYEYINMDAVMEYYGTHQKPIPLEWITSLPIQTLVLSSALYKALSITDSSFQVISVRGFTQEDVDTMFECLHDY
jgi:hypothetical protein